jgi:uncharacterized membrane protein YtjA (UPF0391 family)
MTGDCKAPNFAQSDPGVRGIRMLKFAIVLLVVSLIAGAVGMTNASTILRRISFVLFGILFLGFLALLVFAYLLGAAFDAGQHSMLEIVTLTT